MKSVCLRIVLACLLTAGWLGAAQAQTPAFTHKEDVIYGRKYGTALTMDVFTPKEKANGIGIIWAVSGGWFSDHGWIANRGAFQELLQRWMFRDHWNLVCVLDKPMRCLR